mgnify:FL=1
MTTIMGNAYDLIKGQVSGYVVFLVLLASIILIFVDRRELSRKNLKKESKFAFILGCIYLLIAIGIGIFILII